MEGLFILVGLGFFFGPLILAIVALTKAAGAARALRQVTAALAEVRAELRALTERLGGGAAPLDAEGGAGPEPAAPVAPGAAEPEQPESAAPPIAEDAADAVSPAPAMAATPPRVLAPAVSTRERLRALEEKLAGRWLVWLGAVAIALGGTFLVKYAMDRGLLGPATRVTLGFLMGLALIVVGEVLRRKPAQRAIAAIRADYVPPALTASGLFTAFASILAAHSLYGLIPPVVAFAVLVLIAAAAVGLSLLHGWFVALIGLIGAFVTPALVSVSTPSAWSLFTYLLVVQAASLTVLRYRLWTGLALAALAFACAWPLVWLAVHWQVSDALPLGGYLLATAALFLHFGYGGERPAPDGDWLRMMSNLSFADAIGWIAAAAATCLMFLVVRAAGYSVTALIFLGLLAALYFVVGRRDALFDGLAALGAGSVVLALALWELPNRVTLPRPMFQFQGREVGVESAAPLVPPELSDFTLAGLIYGGSIAIGGFAALWGAKRPALWAAVSAATPVLVLAVAYWRIKDFGLDIGWAALALGLAVLGLGAAAGVARHRETRNLSLSLGFYSAATVAFLSLGLTMTLRDAWLTVAFSLQLPALAWIHRHVRERGIEIVALIVAGLVLARLVVNYNVLDYALAGAPPFNWVLYGYGIPALAFFWAARMFRTSQGDQAVMLLEAGAIVFTVLLVSLQIRLFIEGSLDSPSYRLQEQSLQSISWLAMGYGLALNARRRAHAVSLYGSRILLGMAAVQVIFLQVLVFNPLVTHDPVGVYPVFNTLLLAYAVPAGFALRLAAEESTGTLLSRWLVGIGFLLVFLYISLEVTRAFQGPRLDPRATTNSEFYAYSLVWLIYAGALLAVAILRRATVLRYASLAVLLITVLKVFLFDMSDLTGLLRAASFLGLGLSLVGIGYLYQRFVFGRPAPAAPSEGKEGA
ncbi:MAG: DUF2339 domain-containing protein [Alphaproteobacteria bacterium]|nr:DUF2339 domain-containing protein [Alphaproteobacteria bacterium]